MLFALAPIFVLLLARALRQEAITPRKVVGMTVALAGVVVLQLTAGTGGGAGMAGDALILCGVVAFSLFTVFGKEASGKLGSIKIGRASCRERV